MTYLQNFYEISAGPVDSSNEYLNKCFQDNFQIRHLCYFCLVLLCFHARLFVDALLGRGWPLGSRLWCLVMTLSLSNWYPGSGVVLDCIDS